MAKSIFRRIYGQAPRFLIAVLIMQFSVGCAGPRAVTGLGTVDNKGAQRSSLIPLLVATTRERVEDPEIAYSRSRADALMFSSIDVRIPDAHRPGDVPTSSAQPDPRRQFTAANYQVIPNADAFVREMNAQLMMRSESQREVFIFVHGYNNNFAEALFRNAQIAHDYDVRSVPVHFSWASAANFTRYLYDRDSAIIARNGLAQTLQLAARTNTKGIIVVGHSMGALVVMEALRTLSMEKRTAELKKIKGVLLAAPDIDPDMFQSQVNDIEPLPQPFTIVVSRRDRALDISRRLTGGNARIGSGADIGFLQKKNIQVLDISQVDSGGHSSFASSNTLIKLLGSGKLLRQMITDEYAGLDDAFVTSGQSTFEQASLVLHLPVRIIDRLSKR
ncbi:alpha/beta fold hydrolase [Ochrobactrum sp. RH2CCR150]|uniref:alpha/beta hydrolase n=1 Tax=Ochrobactrum sp. RH2CCR150 TaxID=2587044 RepID=UPI0015F8472E|nr:esterase/lipase superfamily enzyme [Ochrobactrum sp. RH2CCR150]